MLARSVQPEQPLACTRPVCPYGTPCRQEIMERVLDPSPAATAVVCLTDGIIVWRNRAAAALGLELECPLADLVPGDQRPLIEAAIAEPRANVRHRFAVAVGGLDLVATVVWPDDPAATRQSVLYLDTQARSRAEEALAVIASELMWAGMIPSVPARIRTSAGGVELMTPRERHVLAMIVTGRSVQSIASDLYVTASTVRNYLSAIYLKLGVSNRAELLEKVLE